MRNLIIAAAAVALMSSTAFAQSADKTGGSTGPAAQSGDAMSKGDTMKMSKTKKKSKKSSKASTGDETKQ